MSKITDIAHNLGGDIPPVIIQYVQGSKHIQPFRFSPRVLSGLQAGHYVRYDTPFNITSWIFTAEVEYGKATVTNTANIHVIPTVSNIVLPKTDDNPPVPQIANHTLTVEKDIPNGVANVIIPVDFYPSEYDIPYDITENVPIGIVNLKVDTADAFSPSSIFIHRLIVVIRRAV